MREVEQIDIYMISLVSEPINPEWKIVEVADVITTKDLEKIPDKDKQEEQDKV